MTHAELVERAFNLPELREYDLEVIDAMPDSKLREILGIPEPAPIVEPLERKPRQKNPRIRKPERVAVELVARDGCLMRRESWRTFAADGSATIRDEFIPCGARVVWRGRVVSSSIVLHYLQTGQIVSRVARAEKKPYRAVVRDGSRVRHLGYFATAEERDAAVLMYRLNQTISNPLGDK